MSVGTTAIPAVSGVGIILIQNLGAGNVYVGKEDVSTANGIKIIQNGVFSGPFNEQLWLVADVAAMDVRVMYVYLKGERGFFRPSFGVS